MIQESCELNFCFFLAKMVRFGLEYVLGSSCWNVPLTSYVFSINYQRQKRQRQQTRLPFRYVTPLIFSWESDSYRYSVFGVWVRDRDRRSDRDRSAVGGTSNHIPTLGTRNKKMRQQNRRGTNTPYFLYIYAKWT